MQAHPHVFIDAAIALVFDTSGRLEAVRVDWSYDAFYSLMQIEERGLDADGDGNPEQAALDAYAGQDVDWEGGFPGDLTIVWNGEAQALAGPEDHGARFEDGRLITSHIRPLETPLEVDGATVTASVYDPTYFVAYDVPSPPVVEGRTDCAVTRIEADRKAAEAEYGAQLAAIDATENPFEEVDLPDIGVLFADHFVLECPASS